MACSLPLVIGEFGNNHSDGDPDEDAIMQQAQSNGIGYMGWSWCGNSGGVEYLDMVNNWDPNSLTSWGDRIINGANGIKQTSQECSVYGGIQPTTPPPATVTATPTQGVPPTFAPSSTQPAGICSVDYVVQNQWGSGATVNVTVGNNSSASINGWMLTWTFPGSQQITQVWGGSYSQSGSSASISNISWNATIPANGSIQFGLNLTYSGSNPVPTDFALNGTPCNGGGPVSTQTPTATVPTVNTPTPTIPPVNTPTPTVPTATPTQVVTAACLVDYAIQNDWGSGATINVMITNNGSSTIDGWTLCWSFPGSQQITNLWNGGYSQTGASVCVSDVGWNAAIGANGGMVSFGFNLSYSGSNAVPASFSLNGVACQ